MSQDANKLDELAAAIVAQVPKLIGEATDAINAAVNATIEDQQENGSDSPAKVKLPFNVTWCLDSNTVDVKLPIRVTHKFQRNVVLGAKETEGNSDV